MKEIRLTRLDNPALSFDLLQSGFCVIHHGWTTKTADESTDFTKLTFGANATFKNIEPIVEVIPIMASGTPESIIANINEIEREWLEQSRLYNSDFHEYGVPLLEWKGEGEAAAKQQLIYHGSIQYPADLQTSVLLGESCEYNVAITLTLICHGYRESVDQKIFSNSSVPAFCGTLELGSGGTSPSRVQQLSVQNDTGAVIGRLWAGIRPKYRGVSGFIPDWNLTLSSISYGSIVADATAISGDMVSVPYAPNLLNVLQIYVRDVQPSPNEQAHFLGSYVVLLRYRTSSTVKVQASTIAGFSGFNERLSSPVYLDPTGGGWHLAEIGQLTIPPFTSEGLSPSDIGDIGMGLYVEHLAGVTSLDIDSICLIPNKHIYTVEDVKNTGGHINISTWHDDSTRVLSLSALSRLEDAGTPGGQDFYTPVEGGVMVVAVAQQDRTHGALWQIGLEARIVERWKSLRGVS